MSKKYKIIHRIGSGYYIKVRKRFLCFTWWSTYKEDDIDTMGFHHGKSTVYFRTREEAISHARWITRKPKEIEV